MSSVTHSLVHVCVHALSVSVCMCLFGAQQTKQSLYRQTHTHTWDKAQTLVCFIFSIYNQRKGSVCVYLVWVWQCLDGKEIFCGSIPPPSPLSVPPTLSLFRFIFPLSSVSLTHIHSPPTTVSRIFQPSINVAEWIGYIYRCMVYVRGFFSKQVREAAPPTKIWMIINCTKV